MRTRPAGPESEIPSPTPPDNDEKGKTKQVAEAVYSPLTGLISSGADPRARRAVQTAATRVSDDARPSASPARSDHCYPYSTMESPLVDLEAPWRAPGIPHIPQDSKREVSHDFAALSYLARLNCPPATLPSLPGNNYEQHEIKPGESRGCPGALVEAG